MALMTSITTVYHVKKIGDTNWRCTEWALRIFDLITIIHWSYGKCLNLLYSQQQVRILVPGMDDFFALHMERDAGSLRCYDDWSRERREPMSMGLTHATALWPSHPIPLGHYLDLIFRGWAQNVLFFRLCPFIWTSQVSLNVGPRLLDSRPQFRTHRIRHHQLIVHDTWSREL